MKEVNNVLTNGFSEMMSQPLTHGDLGVMLLFLFIPVLLFKTFGPNRSDRS